MDLIWKILQISVAWSIVVASIEYEWDGDPLAIGVLAGMAAYYATGLVNGLVSLSQKIVRSVTLLLRSCVDRLHD